MKKIVPILQARVGDCKFVEDSRITVEQKGARNKFFYNLDMCDNEYTMGEKYSYCSKLDKICPYSDNKNKIRKQFFPEDNLRRTMGIYFRGLIHKNKK
jgi:hypothetical protein